MSASDTVALSRLEAGWTGTIVLTNAATSATWTVTPEDRTSAAEIWAEVSFRLTWLLGSAAYGWADSGLLLHLSTGADFTLVATGTTQSRLKLTGTYASVQAVATASAPDNLLQGNATENGLPPAAYSAQTAASDGVLGARPRVASPTGTVGLYHTTYLSSLLALEAEVDDGATYDLFINGRVVSRFRGGEVVRNRWGTKANQARLDLTGNVVAL